RTNQFTMNPSAAAWVLSSCHSVGGGVVEPVLRIPPPKFARQGTAMRGACGCGKSGTELSGFLKCKAWARLSTSLLASRGVNGASPQRHSINFKTEVWSNTRALTLGSHESPRLKGDATTVGTRHPSSALPFTRSGSTLLAAVARGGAMCSKKPPHSSKFTMNTVLAHFGPLATASKVS